MNKILIEISPGELIDRTTILHLKSAYITDPMKLATVRAELARHEDLVVALAPDETVQALMDHLLMINARLWEIEEDIRGCERMQDFGPKFIALARAVYQTNDERAATKGKIDRLRGSSISEVKSYGNEG